MNSRGCSLSSDWTNRFVSTVSESSASDPAPAERSELAEASVTSVERASALKALCVGRHRYLSDHFGQFFRKLGVDATCVVGVADADCRSARARPDVVFCEYDLLATVPLEPWERDPFLSRVPVIAVSLTRRVRRDAPARCEQHRRVLLPAGAQRGRRASTAARRAAQRRILLAFIARPNDAELQADCLTRAIRHQSSPNHQSPCIWLRTDRDLLSFARFVALSMKVIQHERARRTASDAGDGAGTASIEYA